MRQLTKLLVLLGFGLAVWLSVPTTAEACERTAREAYNPTGWEGCTVYGEGWASRYEGAGVARNDCLWPWAACEPIRITALQTGRSIEVQPVMFCDCWWRRSGWWKLVDLNRAAVEALGLDWAQGRYRVRVEPLTQGLPDTALR